MSEMLFTWGDTVRIAKSAPSGFRPGALVDVVGRRVICTLVEIEGTGYPRGTHLYIVEYEDGSSVEIPEEMLEGIARG